MASKKEGIDPTRSQDLTGTPGIHVSLPPASFGGTFAAILALSPIGLILESINRLRVSGFSNLTATPALYRGYFPQQRFGHL